VAAGWTAFSIGEASPPVEAGHEPE
jgi:hypothetical protein